MRARRLLLAVAALLAACGGDETSAPACAAGETLVDGVCAPAPLPPGEPCPPGEWLRETDGACVPAGVPPDGCAEGFVHDGEGGCDPILPAEACPPGLMAVPGETTCREVAPCGEGTWGDIPVEADTVYVDQSFVGVSDGSASAPFTTIQDAIDAAPSGAIVAVAEGTYVEDVVITSRPRRLWGRCPALVEIEGTPDGFAAIDILNFSSETEVHRLALTGAQIGLSIYGSQNILVEETWIHDSGYRGLEVAEASTASGVTVRGSLIEGSHQQGMFVFGASAVVEASVVRDTLPAPTSGRGISVQSNPTTMTAGSLELRGSIVERNHELGLFVEGSTATIDATVVRDQRANGAGENGFGLFAQTANVSHVRSRLELTRSVFLDNIVNGVTVFGSDAVIDALTVRRTAPGPYTRGWGVGVQEDPVSGNRGNLTLTRSLLSDNHLVGLVVSGSDVTVEGLWVRDTLPATVLEGAPTRLGHGVTIQLAQGAIAPPVVTLRASVIERSFEAGILVAGPASATLDNCVVRDTRSNEEGNFGDGVVVWSFQGLASLSLGASRIEQSARAAIASFGGSVTIASTMLACQSFDLNSEAWGALDAVFENQGDVLCGCPDAASDCKSDSASLEPPAPP